MQNQKNIIALILLTTFLLLVLVSFIFFILFLHQKKQLAFEREMEVLEARYEKELLKTQLEIQEETFEHISLELHDNVGHFISLAKLYLTTLNNVFTKEASEKIEASVLLLGLSLEEIRNISRSLNTENIKSNGLIKTMEQQIKQIERAGIFTIEFDVFGKTCFMDDQKELVLFRIVQEAFNNILKHSKASKIKIRMQYYEHEMDLIINDNGIGFNVNNMLQRCKSNTSGLKNIIKRSCLINATHEIISISDIGTTIKIVTPY